MLYKRTSHWGPSIKFNAEVVTYAGPYIDCSYMTRTVGEAEFIGRLWVEGSPNNVKRSSVRQARILYVPGSWTRPRSEVFVSSVAGWDGFKPSYYPIRWAEQVLFYRRGEFQRRLFAESWSKALTLQYLWRSQYHRNDAVIFSYLLPAGQLREINAGGGKWVADSTWFAEQDKRTIARMASLAATSSAKKR